jgi:hypothetical protein
MPQTSFGTGTSSASNLLFDGGGMTGTASGTCASNPSSSRPYAVRLLQVANDTLHDGGGWKRKSWFFSISSISSGSVRHVDRICVGPTALCSSGSIVAALAFLMP